MIATGAKGSFVLAVIMAFLLSCALPLDDRVVKGSAYGFSIGQTHDQAFAAAVELRRGGKIAEIHRWPRDSSHFEFGSADLAAARQDARWTMIVDPEQWNDSITLEFADGALVEIYRVRICCEMP